MKIWKGLGNAIMGKPVKPRKIYTEEVAANLESDLDDLAKTPKGLKAKELVSRMLPKIDAAIESGHSLEDILEKFNKRGVDISLNTLRQYLQESRAEAANPDLPSAAASNAKPKKTNSKKEQQDTSAPEPDSASDSAFNPRPKVEPEENSDDASEVQPKQKRGSYYSEGKEVSDDFNL